MSLVYPVVLALGCLAGLGWLVARRASSADSEDDSLAAALAALALGLVGARVGFVALHLPYFRRHPVEALWIWEGGLSWVGGAIGVLVAIVVWAQVRRRNPLTLADSLALPAVLIALSAWIGCLLDRCVYGIPTGASPIGIPTPDIFGTIARRWPTAAVGMTATGVLAASLILLQDRRLRSGVLASLVLAGLAAIGLALSFTRDDPALLILGVRVDAIGALGLLALAVVAGVLTRARRPER